MDVDTIDGTVYLKGSVATEAEKERAAQLARSVAGVRAVVNDLEVRTASTGAAGSTSPSASPPSTGSLRAQVLGGQVTTVDPATGGLGLKTSEGDMMLQFPGSMLDDFHVGDQVTIEVDRTPAR